MNNNLLDVVRTALRRKSTALDELELKPLIAAALQDLRAAGVEITDEYDPLTQAAVVLYVRSFIEQNEAMKAAYEQTKNAMALNGDYHA